jgi:hypothetical protein
MDATDTRHIISLSYGGSRLETRYIETKHKWNLGIKTLLMETRVVTYINIWKLNLKTKRQAYWSEDPYHTGYELNLEDEILMRG